MAFPNNQLDNNFFSLNYHDPHSSEDAEKSSLELEEVSSEVFSHSQKSKEVEEKEPVSENPVPKYVESLKRKLERLKKTDKKDVESLNVFEGRRFTFIPYSIDLTMKRIQILSQTMTKKGAIIISPETFRWDMDTYGDVSVLTSPRMPFEHLLSKVPPNLHQEMQRFTFVDIDWTTRCLSRNEFIPPEYYLIYWRHGPQATANRREEKPIEEERRFIPETKLKKVEKKLDKKVGGATKEKVEKKLVEITGTPTFPTQVEKKVFAPKDAIKIEVEDDDKKSDTSLAETEIIEQSEEDDKKEMDIEIEPQSTGKREFPFIKDEEEQENSRKRIKVVETTTVKHETDEPGIIKIRDVKSQKEQILPCQSGEHKNLNLHLTTELGKMLKVVQIEQNQGRVHAYGKAIAVLKALPFKVSSAKDAENIAGLGKRMLTLIEEILATGKISIAEKASKNETAQVLQSFYSIFGVGPSTALSWYNKGMRSIEDLKKNPSLLNHEQKVCVKYYEEFLKKIPRDTVTEIFNIVQERIEKLSDYPGQYEVICAGSYRRGREFCGDVDIIASPKDVISSRGLCLKLVKSLEGELLTDQLSLRVSGELEGETYYGVCYYKGMHRRIDFKICDRERFGPLVAYYTGSEYFNRTFREEAEKRGYRLHNFGLYPLIRVGDKKRSGKLIPCPTEQDLFRTLGLKFIHPEFRDV